MFSRLISYLQSVSPQGYVNALIVLIGLIADLISLGLFFGVLFTPVTGSNFYVNSREFLAWVLVAIVYSIGFLNAVIRRRWRGLYGSSRADHSVKNLLAWTQSEYFEEDKAKKELRLRNFKRDFSILYVAMFPITFLYSRTIAATQNATGITSSPWIDVFLSAIFAIPVTLFMMVVTSIFDYAMSMFKGDQIPQD